MSRYCPGQACLDSSLGHRSISRSNGDAEIHDSNSDRRDSISPTRFLMSAICDCRPAPMQSRQTPCSQTPFPPQAEQGAALEARWLVCWEVLIFRLALRALGRCAKSYFRDLRQFHPVRDFRVTWLVEFVEPPFFTIVKRDERSLSISSQNFMRALWQPF